MKLKRFIVMGGFCEYIADYYCLALSVEDALVQWDEAFPTCQRALFLPTVCCIEDRPDMEKYWRGHGHRVYSGGYKYHI